MGRKSTRIMGYLNSLGGGIFIGIGLFLLLPEAKKAFEIYFAEFKERSPWYEMPYSFFIAFATYSFLLFFEKVAFNINAIIPDDGLPHHHHEEEKEGEVNQVKEDSSDEDEEVFKNVVSTRGKFASFMQVRECKGFLILSK
jgi:hypothetical protein